MQGNQRSVWDFKQNVFKLAGVEESSGFCRLSNAHAEFFSRLNDLGWEKRTKNPNETANVDATAPLTNAEWVGLEADFRRLQ